MSTVIDVSGKLGEYMLKGWVLTDKICPKCSKVPLMRSPSGPTVHFCANCDAAPSTSTASSSRPGPIMPNQILSAHGNSNNVDEKSSASSVSSVPHSRTSTPPTEVSQAPSSPTFAPPTDMTEILRRRQQSDMASAEIGRRMLKGWAMLADECPNPNCYGVPLVRPPKAGGEKDPRKECVVCGTVYVDGDNASGPHLVPLQPSPGPSTGAQRSTLLAQPPQASVPVPSPPPISAPQPLSRPPVSSARAQGESFGQGDIIPPEPFPAVQAIQPPPSVLPAPSSSHLAVHESIQSLEMALHALSERMAMLSNSPVLETALIAQTADAMGKVAQALAHARQLR